MDCKTFCVVCSVCFWGVSGEAMMYEGKRALICDISTHDVLNFRSTVRKTNMDRDTYGKPEKHELF